MDKEIWFTTTSKGARMAWKFSPRIMRATRVALAQAHLEIATGASVEILKPMYVGGKW
jgi:hypothetical protein